MSETTTQTSGDEYDPFAVFDEAMGTGAVTDPYPVFAELRAECPVHAGRFEDRFGPVAGVDPAFLSEGPQYTPLSFEAVQTVLKDGETFSSSAYADSMGLVMGHSILEMDEPEHHRYRSLIAQAFTRKAMERWEAELVRPIVHGLIDDFVAEGRADLVRELFWPFPVHVIAGMLGLPAEELPQFHRKAVELISIGFDIERGLEASQWLYDFFAAVIADRREHPRGDVISVLAEAELDGQRLTDEEIIAFLRLLLPAGAETTYRSSSNLMFGLLGRPEQLVALRDDRSLMAAAIEEGLRWEPPLTGIGRTASRDVELDGVHIPGRRADQRVPRRREPGPVAMGPARRVRPRARAEAAPRVRLRTAHVPRHAPRPYGDDRRDQRGARPAPQRAPRPVRPGAADHRADLPRAGLAARRLRLIDPRRRAGALR